MNVALWSFGSDLRDAVGDGRARRIGELLELVERVVELGLRGVGREDTDEDRTLAGGCVVGKQSCGQRRVGMVRESVRKRIGCMCKR